MTRHGPPTLFVDDLNVMNDIDVLRGAAVENSRAKGPGKTRTAPYHVTDDSFRQAGAEQRYGPATAPGDGSAGSHMPDDVTRELARRMHYTAWRTASARDERGRS